jgi:hypothetical protein
MLTSVEPLRPFTVIFSDLYSRFIMGLKREERRPLCYLTSFQLKPS